MNYGICPLSSIPVRRVASDTSEMVSQILFGETFEIISKRKSWARVRTSLDQYEGWIDANQFLSLSESDFEEAISSPTFSLELVQPVMAGDHYVPILMGSNLPQYDGINFHLNGTQYTFSGSVIEPTGSAPDNELILKIARKYLYAPYLWGGRSPFGLDCSGFVQVVYKMGGISLPRDAHQQVYSGSLVDFIHEVRPGDLAFFQNERGKVGHVGIILPEGQIIHASGRVRIDLLDHFGIWSEEKRNYTHKLRVVKRILPIGEGEAYPLNEKVQTNQKTLL